MSRDQRFPAHVFASERQRVGRSAMLALVLCLLTSGISAAQPSSVYTQLGNAGCVPVKRPSAAPLRECRGVGGWSLLLQTSIDHVSIRAVLAGQPSAGSSLADRSTRGAVSVGPYAEWRVRREGGQRPTPYALIVRVNGWEAGPGGRRASISYLAVSRIAVSGACLVARIPMTRDAARRAEQVADLSALTPCLGDGILTANDRPGPVR